MSNTKFAVLGSSYVRSLEEYLDGDMRLSGDCRFFGVDGMRTDSVPSFVLRQLFEYAPDVVAVHLGGNDVSITSTPAGIFSGLLKLQTLLLEGGVGSVVFMSVCPKGIFSQSPGLTKGNFTRQRVAINRLLGKSVDVDVVKLKMIYPADYCNDGVTFNAAGLQKYSYRVRGALIWSASRAFRQPLGPIVLSNISLDSYTVCWVKPNLISSGDIVRGFLIESSSDNVKWTKTAEVDKTATSFTVEKYDTNMSQFVRVFCCYDGGMSRPLTSCDLKNVIAAKVHTLNVQKNEPTSKPNSVKPSNVITTKAPGKPSNLNASKAMPTKVPGTSSNVNASKAMATKVTGTPGNVNASKVMPTKIAGTPTNVNASKAPSLQSNVNASKAVPTKTPGTSSNLNASKASGMPSNVNISKMNASKAPGIPSNVNASKSPGTPSNVNASKATGTPSNVNASKATETPSNVNASKATGTPSNVNASKATGTPSNVNASKAPGTPRNVNASKATGTPSNVNVSKAPGTPSNVNASKAPGTPCNVNASKAPGTPNNVNASKVVPTKALGTLSSVNASKATVTPSNMNASKVTGESKPSETSGSKNASQVIKASDTSSSMNSTRVTAVKSEKGILLSAGRTSSGKGGLLPTPQSRPAGQRTGLLPTPMGTFRSPMSPPQLNLPQNLITDLMKKPCGPLVVTSVSGNSFTVSWVEPQKTGWKIGFHGFIVELSSDNATWTRISQANHITTSCTFANYNPSKSQFVRVSCQFSDGVSSPLISYDLKKVIASKALLKKPWGPLVVVSASSEMFVVKWCIPTPTGPSFKGFLVERSTNNLSWTKVADVGKAVSGCNIKGSVGNGQYVRVFAVYDGGKSDPLVSCNLVDVIAAKVKQAEDAVTPLAQTLKTRYNKNPLSFHIQDMLRPVGSHNNRMQAPASSNENRGNSSLVSSLDKLLNDSKPALATACKYFPKCDQQRCKFPHPPCPNPNCSGLKCQYRHDWLPAGNEYTQDPDDVNSQLEIRCPQWPNCEQRSICHYAHPNKPCRNFPNCEFGDSCFFHHPLCDNAPNCKVSGCPYSHLLVNTSIFGKNVQVLCKHWPDCKAGSDCRFIHPEKPCRSFPNCRYGETCLYIHPPCSKGLACKIPECLYSHTKQKASLLGPGSQMGRNANEQATNWPRWQDSNEHSLLSIRNSIHKEQVKWPSSAQPSDNRFNSSQKAGGKLWPKKECPDGLYCSKGPNCPFIHPRPGSKRHAPPENQLPTPAAKSFKSENDAYPRQFQTQDVWQPRANRISDEYASQERQNRTRNLTVDRAGKHFEGPAGSRMYDQLTRDFRSSGGSAPSGYLEEEEEQDAYGSDRWVDPLVEDPSLQFGGSSGIKWNRRQIFDYSEKHHTDKLVKEHGYGAQSQDNSKYPLLQYPLRKSSDYEADTNQYPQASKLLSQSRERRVDTGLERIKPLLNIQEDEWLPYDQSMYTKPTNRHDALLRTAEQDGQLKYNHSMHGQYGKASRRPDSYPHTTEQDEELAYGATGRRHEALSRKTEEDQWAYDKTMYGQAASVTNSHHSQTKDDEWAYDQAVHGQSQGVYGQSRAVYGQSQAVYGRPSGAARNQLSQSDKAKQSDEWSTYGPYGGPTRSQLSQPDKSRQGDEGSAYGPYGGPTRSQPSQPDKTRQGDEWSAYGPYGGPTRSQLSQPDKSRQGDEGSTYGPYGGPTRSQPSQPDKSRQGDEWSAYGPYGGPTRSQPSPSKKAKPDDEQMYNQSVYGQQKMASSRREILHGSDRFQDGGWYEDDQGPKRKFAEKTAYPYPLYESDETQGKGNQRETEVYDYDPYAWQ